MIDLDFHKNSKQQQTHGWPSSVHLVRDMEQVIKAYNQLTAIWSGCVGSFQP